MAINKEGPVTGSNIISSNERESVMARLEDGVWIYTDDPAGSKIDHVSWLIEAEQKARFPDVPDNETKP